MKQIGFAVLTLAVYSAIIGFDNALLLIVAIGFHESSHLLAAHKLGLKTKGFYLIPFVGGVALIEGRYKSLWQQAQVVLAGPVGGGLLAGATALVWYFTGNAWIGRAATIMCLLNLFNLLPFSFMDGGQLLGTITYTVSRTLGFVCLTVSTVVAAAFLLYSAPVLGVLIVLVGGSSLLKEFNNWNNYRKGNHYLCTEDYLYPPTKLSGAELSLTLGGWSLTTGLLILLAYVLLGCSNYYSRLSQST